MSENRREVRYAARIVARLERRGETLELLTHDVSFRGAFLRTDAQPSLRQLVKVAFVLPNHALVSAHAMIVHLVKRADDAEPVPGIGLQFWGPITGQKQWEAFVQDLQRRERAGNPLARPTDKIRRASERIKLAIDVVLDGKRAMTRDISFNGIAVRTDAPMPVGTRAALQLSSHDGKSVEVAVIVRRRIDEPGFRGLGVEFVDVGADAKEAIVAFVRARAPEEVVLVPPSDPQLH